VSKQLIPAQRREKIQEYLTLHKIAPSSELSSLLGVSEATVRRDLEWMENEGILYRTHGGAILSQHLQLEPEYTQRAKRQVEEKHAIGRLAASLIEDGDIVFINSGTTTTQIIRHIPSGTNVTVITNNLQAALDVGKVDFELVLIGGAFQSRSNSVAGRFAIENLGQIYASKSFVGVDGISPKYGCTSPSSAAAEVTRLMMARTRGPVTVVADHSKWGVVSNFIVASVDQIHRLISDDGLNDSARDELIARSVEILVVATNKANLRP
jgi:DeoR family fructose operon transcriptional repressor